MGGLRGADGIIGYDRLYPSDRAYIAVVRHPGFLAAVNMLLQSAAYALMDRGHLFVDFSRAPFDMTDVFKARFAGPEAYDQRRYARVSHLSKKFDSELWDAMREHMRRAIAEGAACDLPEIGFSGDVEALVARLADALFDPVEEVRAAVDAAVRELGLGQEPYAAFHVRRGDKVNGFVGRKGKVWIEGELVPLDAYVARLRAIAPSVSRVFLMTDDYGAYEEAVASFPDLRFVTLCPPTARGYDQVEHNASEESRQIENRRSVVRDIAIARGAEVFVGAYLSNVSLFVHALRGGRYDRSASADSAQRWGFI
jgi:hypothetical protein